MKVKTALLINPPTGNYIRDDRCQAPVKYIAVLRMPIDLAYIAGVIEPEGLDCEIRDYPAEKKNTDDFVSDLEKTKPDILFISTTTPTIKKDLEICRIAKKTLPNVIIIVKGAHVTIKDIEVLEDCRELDIVIRGEYEVTAKELVQELKKENCNLKKVKGISFRKNQAIFKNKDREPLENLDTLPFPARHLLQNELYVRPDTNKMQTTIQTNRGCPANCTFCLVKVVSGKNIFSRSPKNIADEIEECIDKYGIRDFYFRADTFTWNNEWMKEVCEEIIKRNLKINWGSNSRVNTLDEEKIKLMKKSGCWMLGLGIESGSQDILNKMKKGIKLEQVENAVKLCKKYKIKIFAFFVIGYPDDNEETINETINFAKKINADFTEFNTCYPYPGTEVYNEGIKSGLYSDDMLYGKDQYEASMPTKYLKGEEVTRLRDKAEREFLLRPAYFFRTLKNINSTQEFFNYFKFGLAWIRSKI